MIRIPTLSLTQSGENMHRDSGLVATPDAFLSLTGVAMGRRVICLRSRCAARSWMHARTCFPLVWSSMKWPQENAHFAGNTRPELHEAILTQAPSPCAGIEYVIFPRSSKRS